MCLCAFLLLSLVFCLFLDFPFWANYWTANPHKRTTPSSQAEASRRSEFESWPNTASALTPSSIPLLCEAGYVQRGKEGGGGREGGVKGGVGEGCCFDHCTTLPASCSCSTSVAAVQTELLAALTSNVRTHSPSSRFHTRISPSRLPLKAAITKNTNQKCVHVHACESVESHRST